MKTILVTGCAGFIGSNLVDSLIADGIEVIGLDNFDDYYSPEVKKENISNARKSKNFKLYEMDILNEIDLEKIFKKEKPSKVVHLAAKAGVRLSILNPVSYTKNNVEGTVRILNLSNKYKVEKFIFASSSSVYGQSDNVPFDEESEINSIAAPYGATKRCGEFFVESFYKNFGLKSIIFRFFTVYGKRGRPDMAPFLFSNAVIDGNTINVFGDGNSSRDYTYIDDIVDAIKRGLEINVDFAIINLGNNHPVKLNDFIGKIEKLAGRKAKTRYVAKQRGDVDKTWASIVKARKLLGWSPKTKLEDGLRYYIKWLKEN